MEKGAKYQFRCGDQQTRKLRISFAFQRRLSLLYLSIKSWKTFFALRHQQDYCGRATLLRATLFDIPLFSGVDEELEVLQPSLH